MPFPKNSWLALAEANSLPNSSSLAWITNNHILTQAIKAKCATYALKLLRQELAPTPMLDQEALNSSFTQSLIRQVLQTGDGVPLCYARTTIPLPTFEKYRSELENLGERPIGETLLHNNPDISRSTFEICQLTSSSSLLQEVNQHLCSNYNELWARRSIFWLKENSLLITEVFLPEIQLILS